MNMLLMFAYMNFQWVSVVSEGSDTFCILSQNAPCPDDFTFKQKENHEHCGDDADNCEFKLECDQRNCVSCGRSCKPVKSCKCTISDSLWQQLKADVTSVTTTDTPSRTNSPGEEQCFDWCICKYVPKGFFPWLSNPHKDKPDKCFRASNPRNNARVRRCMLKSGCDKKCDGNGYGAWECKCKCDQEDCKGCEFEDEKVAITELL